MSDDVQSVLGALTDDRARRIVESLTEPMTATEVAETCDMPISTTYKKLDRLTAADLLDERTRIRPDGHHATAYAVDFETVEVTLAEDNTLDVSVLGSPTEPAEQLADLWSNVRSVT